MENFHRAKDDSDATLEIFFNLVNLQAGLGELNKDLYQKFSKFNIESFKNFAPFEISKHLANFEFYENKKIVKNEIDDPVISVSKKCAEFFLKKKSVDLLIVSN